VGCNFGGNLREKVEMEGERMYFFSEQQYDNFGVIFIDIVDVFHFTSVYYNKWKLHSFKT